MIEWTRLTVSGLKAAEVTLISRLQAIGRIDYERRHLTSESRCDLDDLKYQLGRDLKGVRDELRIVRERGLGTAPLPELTEAPTAIAS